MEVIALFNLYANGVSVFAKAPLFRTRAHAVGVAVIDRQIVIRAAIRRSSSWPDEFPQGIARISS